jgi:hypothetical protein
MFVRLPLALQSLEPLPEALREGPDGLNGHDVRVVPSLDRRAADIEAYNRAT